MVSGHFYAFQWLFEAIRDRQTGLWGCLVGWLLGRFGRCLTASVLVFKRPGWLYSVHRVQSAFLSFCHLILFIATVFYRLLRFWEMFEKLLEFSMVTM